ncbi:transglutaminase family protein [uncultured Amaricoccus sp.]|uniref:transglutaminase family protein n=1 Tax=uncultured Amaricoccus sp. TaxID=339341 RepID=UPI002630E801|nr:transglutaminase family protein [uncultured Amaricoccus sp.]
MTIFNVRHVTSYRYKRPVGFGDHQLMFRPRDSYDQHLHHAELKVDPPPKGIRWMHDVFGNAVAMISFEGRASQLRFETNIRLDHTPHSVPSVEIAPPAKVYPFTYGPDEAADLACTIKAHYPDDEIGRWARRFVRVGRPTSTGRLLMTMCFAIHESFVYARRHEHGTQPPMLTLRLRRGTCRDFALLMMEAVRSLGFAARFVTGYVYVPSHDDTTIKGGGSTHAWCQVYLPGAGWVEFDPTNGIVGNRDLIRVGVARDPRQAMPLVGSYHGQAEDFAGMSVEVRVTKDGAVEEFTEGPRSAE